MAFDNKQLQKILTSAVQALGYDLWGFELSTGGKRLLIRVYIDAAKGISVDDCALASRQINAMLEVDMPDLSDYILEVSSPGMDRPLFTLAQYTRYLGETMQIRTGQMYEGRRNFTGTLEAITEDKGIVLKVDEQQYHLSFADIEKAKLLPKILINRKS
ncbi:MAG: ribosome maturation factor RimP [Gammaproteobacteria bacterium]|jgi:ribosome maturation factor RimP|nr:ribosome maturation factor RimP [Gammaproteobacteria bacterium]